MYSIGELFRKYRRIATWLWDQVILMNKLYPGAYCVKCPQNGPSERVTYETILTFGCKSIKFTFTLDVYGKDFCIITISSSNRNLLHKQIKISLSMVTNSLKHTHSHTHTSTVFNHSFDFYSFPKAKPKSQSTYFPFYFKHLWRYQTVYADE